MRAFALPFVSLFLPPLSDTSPKTTTLIVIFIKEKQETQKWREREKGMEQVRVSWK